MPPRPRLCVCLFAWAVVSEAATSTSEPSTTARAGCLSCIRTEDGKCYFPRSNQYVWWENEPDRPCSDCSLCQEEDAAHWRKIESHDWVFAIKGTGCTIKNAMGKETERCLQSTTSLKTQTYGQGSSCSVMLKKEKYLTFEDFATERKWDKLSVISLNRSAGPKLLHNWNGLVVPPARTFQNSWKIQWAADYSIQKKGWKLCSGCPTGSEDTADGNCKCSSGFVCKNRKERQLPIPGWDISWIQNCSASPANNTEVKFRPDQKGIQCISEREEFTVYVAVMLSGAFEMSAMLVLSLAAYLLPLCLFVYLLAVLVFNAAANCSMDTQNWESKIRGCFTEFFVASNDCWCRRRGALAYVVVFSLLTTLAMFEGAGLLALWPGGLFCLSSLAIYYWHKRVASAAEEAKLSCWSWGCCLCCVFCWNPLGSCLPLTTSETLEKAAARTHLEPVMQEMQEPLMSEGQGKDEDALLAMSSPLHRLLAKPKNELDEEQKQMQLFKCLVDKYGHFEGVSAKPGEVMLWLAKWTVQQPGSSSGSKRIHAFLVELGPILYAFLWSLVAARICLEHQDGFIAAPIPGVFGHFAPILADYEFDLGILPTCLAVHFTCIALSCLVESRAATQRLREWLYTYGPLQQWKEMYPNANQLSDATYAQAGEEGKASLQSRKQEGADSEVSICGFKVLQPSKAALPASKEVTLKVAATTFGLLSMGGTLFYLRYVHYGSQEASRDWQMKSTFAVTYPVLFYLLLWLPLVWHRLLNALLFAAECSLLTRTAGGLFNDVSAGNEKRGDVKTLLETLGWKVQDILSDWRLMIKVGFVLDGFGMMTGAMASYRLLIHYGVDQFVPVLVCNCLTILLLLCLQVLPLVTWNDFLEKCAGDENNIDPVLYMWLSQGCLKMNIFGLIPSKAYFVGLALSLAALAEPYISDVVTPPLTEMLTQ